MELLTTSVLTLLALYVLYSEPFKLPTIIKKNKKISYILIIGLYLYYHQSNVVEGSGPPIIVDNNRFLDVSAKVLIYIAGLILFAGLFIYSIAGKDALCILFPSVVSFLFWAFQMYPFLRHGESPSGGQWFLYCVCLLSLFTCG